MILHQENIQDFLSDRPEPAHAILNKRPFAMDAVVLLHTLSHEELITVALHYMNEYINHVAWAYSLENHIAEQAGAVSIAEQRTQ